MSQTCEQA